MALGSVTSVVGTTPTFIGSVSKTVTIQNKNAASIFVGGPDVTTTNGIEIPTTTTGLVTIECIGKVYAISAAGGGTAARFLLS
jgi:hypothetical protein